MSTPTLDGYLRRLKHAMSAEALAERSDRELVDQFRQTRDDSVFRAIVDRHGAMVFQVCRRLLSSTADVEDAFQATFLVLVRRGHAIRKQGSLASWLHGVARRTSLKLRTQAERRRRRENKAAVIDGCAPEESSWSEIRGILDDELQRLPESCRSPLVLCYLEGRTQDEAAAQLDVSKSTLRRRLDRGREMIGRRLTQRGISLSAALGSCLVAESVSGAAVPRALIVRTAESVNHIAGKLAASAGVVSPRVAAITDGVVKSMNYAKYKTVFAVLACGVSLAFGIQQVSPTKATAQDHSQAKVQPANATPDIDPIDPSLVFETEVQRHLKLSQNQKRQLGEAYEKGTATTAEQAGQVKEIDAQMKRLQEEMDRLNVERSKHAQVIHKAQTDQVRAAIPKVLSDEAIAELRKITIQRMNIADVLLDKKMRAKLDLNDEQIKKIQELSTTQVAWARDYAVFAGSGLRSATLLSYTTQRQNIAQFYVGVGGVPDESRSVLLQVLTPKQRETFDRLSGAKQPAK